MLQSRGVNCDIHCVMCETGAVETSKHLFFECQNATGVWARFVNLMQVGDSVCDTWNASQIFYCSNMGGNTQTRQVWATYFMSVLWSLWRQRNEVIFREKKPSQWFVANRAAEEAKLWLQFCGKSNRNVWGAFRGTDSITNQIAAHI